MKARLQAGGARSRSARGQVRNTGWAVVILLLGSWLTGCGGVGPESSSPPAPELPPPSMDRLRPPPEPVERPPAAGPGEEEARPGADDPAEAAQGSWPEAGPGLESEADGGASLVPTLDDALWKEVEPQVRALWVVRTSLVHPDSARAAVQRAHRAGFNTLLVQVRGRGDAWYRSGLEPRADPLAGTHPAYDPLQVVLDEARALGLSVHAWLNVHLVAGATGLPSDELHLVHRRPEYLSVPRELAYHLFAADPRSPQYRETLMAWARENGSQVEGLYTSPLLPEVTEHLTRVVGELLAYYDLDGIHLDYLRFPSSQFDFSRPALEAFRSRLRATRPRGDLQGAESWWNRGEIMAYVDAFPGEWDQFRRDAITQTLRQIRGVVEGAEGGLTLTAAVFPDLQDARNHRFQPWEEWLQGGLVDAVAPMSYTDQVPAFRRALERARAAGGGSRIWMGVGSYTNTFPGAVGKGRMIRDAGVAGIVLFSYDWAVGPEGRANAGGDYLGLFSREVFLDGLRDSARPGPGEGLRR
jgi:uncharacterized lipoprotein YddW (UPF0748 family)